MKPLNQRLICRALAFCLMACVLAHPRIACPEVIQVRIRKNVMMPARDGVRLATDVYLPDGDPAPKGPFPAILIRTPYNKAGVAPTAEFFTTHGFAVAVQDVRGRFASGGTFYIYTQEGRDGYDACEWVAAQSWCNGKVGTWGGSYLAATQNALAVLRPPHLRTMFVLVGTSNYIEDGAGRGGAFALLHNMAYGFRLASDGQEAKTHHEDEVKVTPAGAALSQSLNNLSGWLNAAPLKQRDSPLQWTPSYRRWYADWRAHPTYDAYWKQNGYNFEEHYSQMPDIPICLVGGWYDIFKRGTLANFRGFSGREQYVHLMMGPWTHSTGRTFAGDVDFGPAAKVDMKQAAARWFEQFLRGKDHNLDEVPPVRYFLMGGGETARNSDGRLQSGGSWKTSAGWPPDGFSATDFYLSADGSLRTQPASESNQLQYEFDPRNPVPTIGGNIDSGKQLVRRGAQNQVLTTDDFLAVDALPLSARPDVLVFQTPPLQNDLEVTGSVQVDLWYASTARDTDVTAKLIDVFPPSDDYPSGYAMNVEEGILRLRFRNSRDREELMQPGKPYRVTVDLWDTACLFRKGHRIRLDISSSSFPMYDVNPNTGEPLGKHTHLNVARQSVFVGGERRSRLILPVKADGNQ